MRFDNRVKILASLSCLFCFTFYLTNVTAMSFGAHVHPFLVG
jgi:hypothetical protein